VTNWAIEHLLSTQNSDGGWGAHPGGPSRTETTALAALAIGRTRETAGVSNVTSGLDWLRTRQQSSGASPPGD
jgi:prenyltransferase beta subunit